MYDPLYALLPQFTASTGIAVDVVAQLPHPELNAWVQRTFRAPFPRSWHSSRSSSSADFRRRIVAS